MTDASEQALTPPSAILLIHCPDQRGLVAAVTEFIHHNNGNILYLDQHVDMQEQIFFMRVEWDLAGFSIPRDQIGVDFQRLLAEQYQMQWKLHFSDERPRMAVFVSKLSHCLYDILSRREAGEWQVDLPLIISNHEILEPVARRFDIDYQFIPVSESNNQAQTLKQLALLKDHRIDLIVSARYMQIIPDDFVNSYPNGIINIHHSFLPAFPGARPYHSAHKRGVKIIGVTSHYITSELDAGPIIEQDVVRVSHKDTVEDMIRIGQDLEKVVLARAIWLHLKRKILVYGNRTVVFD